MCEMQREIVCPFPGVCVQSALVVGSEAGEEWECRVAKRRPVIVCSLAELPGPRVELKEDSIRIYLDKHVRKWKGLWKIDKKNGTARSYLEAYQKIRVDLLGCELD